VPSLFRDPVVLVFVDADNRELGRLSNAGFVPRVGENVRLKGVPYTVERVGYDVPEDALSVVWVVCHPA
jgi:hypothetical protein